MLRLIAALVLSATLIGCVATGVQVTNEQAASFQKGTSTQADVEARLGRPTTTSILPNGERYVSYTYVRAQARASSFIPIVGPLVGGADSTSTVVLFRFSPDGKLIDYTSTSSQFGTGTGFAAGSPIEQSDQPRQ